MSGGVCYSCDGSGWDDGAGEACFMCQGSGWIPDLESERMSKETTDG